MSIFQFISYTVITFLTLYLIRVFWKEIFIVGTILYIIGLLILLSFFIMLIWVAFITQDIQGWGWVWLYCFLSLSGIAIVWSLIILDAIDIVIDWLKSVFK